MNKLIHSYVHRGGDTPLLGATIAEHFGSIVSRCPHHEAVVSLPQGRRLSYGQLATAVEQLARGLLAMGFGKGARIGIWSTNNIEWLVLQLATARIGAVLVNINPAYRPRELAYALQRSEVQGLFVIPAFGDSDYIAMLTEVMPNLKQQPADRLQQDAYPHFRAAVVYDPRHPDQTPRPHPGFLLWQEVLAQASSVSLPQLELVSGGLDRDDPINIQYTSGTTGFPKAVLLTHHNILNNAFFAARAMHFGEQDRLAIPVPFYHCFGMVLANLLSLSVGATMVLPCEHFDAGQVLQAIQEEGCTAVHGVPTMFIAELEHPRFHDFALDTLRTGIMAGAPCPPALMKRVIKQMHCRDILIGYGETEASPLTHLTTPEDNLARRVDTVGTNLPHQEVKIVSTHSGATVPISEVGEICFRGYHLMRGYYGEPDKTAEAIDQAGWLHSGDLGTMDADGYVRITGRLKEMIIRGGENIYPREIEDYLFTHPKVAQVAVFGVPDRVYGEAIMAWIALHPGERLSETEVRDYCRGQIAHFKIPTYVWFVDHFPMTVTGKLQKFRMRQIAMETLPPSAETT